MFKQCVQFINNQSANSALAEWQSTSAIYNTFNTERHLVSRKTGRAYRDHAFTEWQAASAV